MLYVSNCDLIYKYCVLNINLIPKIKEIQIQLILSENNINLTYNNKMHLILLYYLIFFNKCHIKYKNFGTYLKLNISFMAKENKIKDTIFKIFHEIGILKLTKKSISSYLNKSITLHLCVFSFSIDSVSIFENVLNNNTLNMNVIYQDQNKTAIKSNSLLKNIPYFWTISNL
jgi:hypothetical protein